MVAAPSVTLLSGAPMVGVTVKDVEVQRKVSKVSLLFSLLVLPAMPVVFLRTWELNSSGPFT